MNTLIFLELILGFLVGVISAALGIGGGVLMVPAFVEFIEGMDQHTAIGTSLLTIAGVSLLNAWRLNRGLDWHWRMVLPTAAGASLMAFLAGTAAGYCNAYVLKLVFGVFNLVLAVQTLRLREQAPKVWKEPGSDAADAPTEAPRVRRWSWPAFGTGSATGLVSGFTGIGGGMVLVPLALRLRLTVNHRVVALSNTVMVFTSLAAVGAYLLATPSTGLPWVVGQVHAPTALVVLLGAQFGSPVGAWLNHRLTLRWRRWVMGGMLLVIGSRMLWRGLAA